MENETDVYRQELGTLITDLRIFLTRAREGEFNYLSRADIFDMLEEIING